MALLEAAMASQAKVSQHTVAHACMDQINQDTDHRHIVNHTRSAHATLSPSLVNTYTLVYTTLRAYTTIRAYFK